MLKILAVIILIIISIAVLVTLYEGLLLPLIQPFIKNKEQS